MHAVGPKQRIRILTIQIAVADEAEQAAVLKRLMLEDEREVIEFTVDQTGLEQLFMQVTEGIVQ